MKDFKFFNKGGVRVRYIGGQTPDDKRKIELSLDAVYTVKYECNFLNNDGSVGEACYYLEEMMNVSSPCGRLYAFATRIFETIN